MYNIFSRRVTLATKDTKFKMEDHQCLCASNNSPTKTQTSEEESTKNVRCCGIVCWKKKNSKQVQITDEHTDKKEKLVSKLIIFENKD